MKTNSFKKKILLLCVTFVLALTLAACNENTVSDVNLNDGTEVNDSVGNAPVNDPAEGEEPVNDADAGLDAELEAEIGAE